MLQEDQIVSHTDAGVGPEPGTTYNLRIYNSDDPATVIRTVAGVASGWVYDAAMQAADGDPLSVWMELESERDGLTSYQHYRFYVPIKTGYGVGYGMNYGGA